MTDPDSKEVTVIGYGKIRDEAARFRLFTTEYFPLQQLDNKVFDFYGYMYVDKSVGIDMRSLFLRGPQRR